MTKKAALYTRSTTGSSESQRQHLLDTLDQKYEVVAEYRDTGRDGSALKNMIEDLSNGKFEVVIVTDPSRLSRQSAAEVMTVILDAGGRVAMPFVGEITAEDFLNRLLPQSECPNGL
jgi:DNA invertase Pin-like site-specific DNA recombinase